MKNSYTKRQIIILSSFLVCFFLGVLFLYTGFQNKKTLSLKYKEDNDIDYKVYLKENAFFEEPFIEKGKTYITSLIDYIDADYSYNIFFDKPVDGEVEYQVIAKIEANKADSDSGNYWTKEYEVTKVKQEEFNQKENYTIHQNVKIDYNQYNEMLNSFKKTLGLQSEGVLKVYLKVINKLENEDLKTKVDSDLILKLPLSELAIEASIDSDVNNQVKSFTETFEDHSVRYLLWKIMGVLLFIASAFFIWLLIHNKKIYKMNNQYELELKKILTTYDSIIVNVEEEPRLDDYNLIKVESFEELIDAHSEIRMPINCYQTNDRSIFILFNDNTAWKYVLEKRKYRRSARR